MDPLSPQPPSKLRKFHVRDAFSACWIVILAVLALPTIAEDIVLWPEVLDGRGRFPTDLTTSDLSLSEDGQPLQITGIETRRQGSAGWESTSVLYFDRALASSRVLKQGAGSLANLARGLTELGEVEVLLVGETPESVLRSRDALILGERLSRAALTETGQRQILEIRQRALRALHPRDGTPALTATEATDLTVQAILEELEWVRQRQQQLLAWVGEAETTAGPRTLFWIVDGFDLDPVSFYTRHLDDTAIGQLLRRADELPPLDAVTDTTAQALALAGWTVVPVSFVRRGDGDGLEYESLESVSPDGNVTSAPGVTVRPSDIFRRSDDTEDAPPQATLLRPLEPLERMAEATGGEVVISDSGLRDFVDRLAQRPRLTARSTATLASPPRALELRSARSGWTVKAPRWWSPASPEAISRARLERLLSGFDGGVLDIAAVLQLQGEGQGQLEGRLALRELDNSTDGEADAPAEADGVVERADAALRVSVAVGRQGDLPTFQSEVFTQQDLSDNTEWHFRRRVDLSDTATEVAVVVEDLRGGGWGGRRATVLAADQALEDVLPAPTVIEIERPDDDILRGRVRFTTRVYDSKVAAVDFILDDRTVARRESPPFAERIDLGRTPRRHNLTVVAYDAKGAELGRDSAVINGGSGGLDIRIVQPTNTRVTGPVSVEAEVEVPLERRLDRVLFFWNNEPVATLYGPPYRQRIVVPDDRPAGYIRVVAMLDDATMAEDVLFMNAPAVASERLDVSLVELYVVVTDEDGRPVRGLGESDFRVREEGVDQQIATFSDASDLPLTLGMAVDSSASMFVKLPRVQQAAIDFLRSTFNEDDRAFVVDFDSEPRLARATTGDIGRLERSILDLEANGRTALWESVTFSLIQLQGVRGRKALIVFSDGADEDDQFPFRTTLDISRKMGVPIYLILMRKEPKDTGGLSLLTRSFSSRVGRLVNATGGRVFYAREYENLDAVYDEIEIELRSQYLLAYYPTEASKGNAWRSVDIDVKKKGLKPRTLSGYWP